MTPRCHAHRWVRIFKLYDRISREFEKEFKNILICLSGAQMGSNDEKKSLNISLQTLSRWWKFESYFTTWTLYTMYCPMYNVLFVVQRTSHCTMYCPMYNAMSILQCTVFCTMFCPLYNVLSDLHCTMNCPFYNALSVVQCSVHCTM